MLEFALLLPNKNMLSLKYIRIRKDRPTEQCLSSIWRDACADFGIPCVLIYLDEKCAYISASLKHLPDLPATDQPAEDLQQQFLLAQATYTGTTQGYWKHSNSYYTFDCIPRETAKEAAVAIFEVLIAYLHQENLPAKLPEPENRNPPEAALA